MRGPRSLALALITALACGPVAAESLKTSPLPRPRPPTAAPCPPPACGAEGHPGGVALPASAGQSPLDTPQPAPAAGAADPAPAGRHPVPRPASIAATAPAESLPPRPIRALPGRIRNPGPRGW
ncbi:hypothetical protein PUH89_16065 [Rhodobacter capsulatus]|uniref:hypothetical protein n=1 Tax=Rhodobacter capsulatus TaxID=1061 RepID=UPI0023E313C4|nr:hypothetical protein [Rhodobacter capsulatus]WER08803.1 hypothetical protein PUH89_16065 [Rhodobacter capsulatus]